FSLAVCSKRRKGVRSGVPPTACRQELQPPGPPLSSSSSPNNALDMPVASNREKVMSDTITILNVDSHPLWSLGVASVINDQPDMRLVAQASTGREAIDYFRAHQTDIILTDIRLP